MTRREKLDVEIDMVARLILIEDDQARMEKLQKLLDQLIEELKKA